MTTSTARLRRTIRGSLTAVLATLTLVLGAGTAEAALPPAELQAVTDDYLFDTSLAGFGAIRAEQPYADQLDWSSNGCSYSPDEPFGFEFLPACDRHDFGYRNYKLQGRFTEVGRLAVDDKFLADMRGVCAGDGYCNATAQVYYQAVRWFGGSGTTTAEAVERYRAAQATGTAH